MNISTAIEDLEIAKISGFAKENKKKSTPLNLGAKHAVRVAINREISSSVGTGILGGIVRVIASNIIKKIK